MRLRFGKEERFLVIALAVIGIYLWLVTSMPFMRDLLDRLWEWLISLGSTQGYIGGFVASFLANFSIIIPIPYTVIIVLIAATDINPLLLGIIAGIGAGLGESSSYVLGYFGQSLTKDIYKRNLKVLQRLIAQKRWYVYIVLFLIGATPVPDDIFIVPLGFLRFGFVQMLIPVALGKMIITIILSTVGKYSNITSTLAGSTQSSLFSNAATLVTSVVVVYVMLKVNWDALGDKLVGTKPGNTAKT